MYWLGGLFTVNLRDCYFCCLSLLAWVFSNMYYMAIYTFTGLTSVNGSSYDDSWLTYSKWIPRVEIDSMSSLFITYSI